MREHHPKPKSIVHSRDEWGVTVSFANDRGDRHTSHRRGTTTAALLECIEEIDARADDGPWFVEAIQTPQTTYDDMKRTVHGESHTRERQLLARVGRKDLLRVPTVRDPVDSSKQSGHAWRRMYGRGPGVRAKQAKKR